ncbi:MAG: ERF family protein [Solirubrobacteraceae bacterium]
MLAEKTTLYSKLAQVVGEVGYVAKDGKNDFQNYRYTSAEALLAAIRGPLSSRGVILMPSLVDIGEREYTTSKGKASIITTARVRFTFVDGESGETHACEWAGQGDDPADKGLGKAYTNAIKTFLREQFLIPTGDDPEADSSTDSRAADRSPGPKLATAADVKEMTKAADGLSTESVKLALAACGINGVSAYNKVPADKVTAFVTALAGMEATA